MKKYIYSLPVLLSAAVLLVLAACSDNGRNAAAPPTAASPAPSHAVSAARPTPSPKPSPSPSPDATYSVKTDYSKLTPYQPPEELYTRLTEDYVPALVPSDDYGLLVPYVGEVVYGKNSAPLCYRYGLMTTSGKIVTDAVYSSISPLDDGLPVYILERQNDAFISEDPGYEVPYRDPYNAFIYALCAADGSWVTSFDYVGVRLRSQTVVLLRDAEKNDADVYDLTGRFLYGTKSMAYRDSIRERAFFRLDDLRRRRASADDIIFMGARYMGADEDRYGEDYYPIEMTDGKFAYIKELTGEITYTDFDNAGEFSCGLAAVSRNSKWGYIDKHFNLVIPLQYASAGNFFSGYSYAGLSENKAAFIDINGKTVLERDYIDLWYDLYHAEQNGTGSNYDMKLNEMTPDRKSASLLAIGGGSYTTEDFVQCELFHNGKKYVFPGVARVIDVMDDLAVCQGYENNNWGQSLLTLDGKTIVPYLKNTGISIIKNAVSGEIYIQIYNYVTSTTRIENLSGTTLLSCGGRIIYNEPANLFGILTDDYFSYADISGNCSFRISLQDSMPD